MNNKFTVLFCSLLRKLKILGIWNYRSAEFTEFTELRNNGIME